MRRIIMNPRNDHGKVCKLAVCPWPLNKGTPGGRASGFSLIELMIVVAIIAVLAAIAYPAYQQYVIKTNRKAAESCLAEQANYMERYYTTNLTYVPGAGTTFPTLDCASTNQTGKNYTYAFPASSGSTTYTITAAPLSPLQQKDTTCGTLKVDQAGTRSVSGTGTLAQCW
jgi:type IV pilus assembly protein PilE